MSGSSLGTRLPNLKFVPSAVLELLAFNAQKLRGHVTVTTPTFRKYLSGVMWRLFLGTRLPNLKFVPSAVLELLAFNAKTFRGHVTVTTPTFRKYLSGVMWGPSLGTCLPNLKFVPSAGLELLAFNAPKFTGSRDRDHAHFSEIFVRGHVGTIPENTPAIFEVRTFSRFGAISI